MTCFLQGRDFCVLVEVIRWLDSGAGNFQMVNFCRLGVVSLERKHEI